MGRSKRPKFFMKRIGICCLVIQLIFSLIAFGQFDKQWYGGIIGANKPPLVKFVLDSQFLNINLENSIRLNMGNYHFTMCDDNGNIQFFTNGLDVYNWKGQIMDNGDSINTCINTNIILSGGGLNMREQFELLDGAYTDVVNCWSIPFPEKKNEYLLFNSCVYEDSSFNKIVTLNYSHINMNINGGSGKVISKENELLRGINLGPSTAVKHANGRDWWVITYTKERNFFYFYLVDPAGVHLTKSLTCGPLIKGYSSYYQDKVSPDGNFFAKIDECFQISIYKIDRCEGVLDYITSINFFNSPFCDISPICTDIPTTCLRGLEFSSNNHYLYAIDVFAHLYQIDLSSFTLHKIFSYTAQLEFCQLLSNEQIVVGNPIKFSPFNQYMHVLRRPNLKGLSADFDINSIMLPLDLESEIQQTPNYSLGKLKGTLCDSL